ncbi:MAG: hypothetical protein M1404_05925 [Acidobacteria bacterium]|nr:hypothetical protein [Acidobacteriota bacterium]
MNSLPTRLGTFFMVSAALYHFTRRVGIATSWRDQIVWTNDTQRAELQLIPPIKLAQ